MDELLELVKSTEKLLTETEENLKKIQKMKDPETLEKRVKPITEKYYQLESQLRLWQNELLKNLMYLGWSASLTICIEGKFYRFWGPKGISPAIGYPDIIIGYSSIAHQEGINFFISLCDEIIKGLSKWPKEKQGALKTKIETLAQLTRRIDEFVEKMNER